MTNKAMLFDEGFEYPKDYEKDMIYREQALETAYTMRRRCDTNNIGDYHELMVRALLDLPSAQPKVSESKRDLSDSINRQDAIDAMKEKVFHNLTDEFYGAMQVLDELPSAQPEQRWIPCEGKLPEDYEDVLVWFEYFRYGDYNCMYSTHGIGTYSRQYDSWMINHETGWKDLRVIAWMPLPESYKGDES